MTLLFNIEKYLYKRGERLNRLGIEVLALNRFLVKYLDSDEHYPPTDEFLQAVEEDINPTIFSNYTPGPIDPEEIDETWLKIPDHKQLDIIAKAVDSADVDMAGVCALSRKKTAGITYLIDVANFCFTWGQHFKMFAAVAGCYDNYLPDLEQLLAAVNNPEDGTAKIKITATYEIHQETVEGLAALEHVFNGINESADRIISRANKELGYWHRMIEEARRRKKGTKPANRLRKKSDTRRKQRVIEIFYSNQVKDRQIFDEHPHKVAGEVRRAWVPSNPKDLAPVNETIIKWIKEDIRNNQ